MIIKKCAIRLIKRSSSFVVLATVAGLVCAEPIGPAQLQEFSDAKSEVDLAVRFRADKYAKKELQEAQDTLQAAEAMRAVQNGVKFSQFTRLARAQAQLAISVADLALETEKLNDTNAGLQKAKEDVSRLPKPE